MATFRRPQHIALSLMPKKSSKRAHSTLSLVRDPSPRERALALALEASEWPSASKQRAAALEALRLDADCLAAHLLLTRIADTPTAAAAHARDAVAAGERTLAAENGPSDLPIWFHEAGRPLLSAHLTLAEILWDMGDRPAAIEQARTVLRLNPQDNQGARYRLLEWLLRAGSLADIEAMLAAYPDESGAMWLFAIALHRFRTEGNSNAAQSAAQAALQANVHVVPMMLGELPFPEDEAAYFAWGDSDEAAMYMRSAASVWLDTAGAIEWIATIERARLRGGRSGKGRVGHQKR